MITAEMVKDLREKTGARMMDCKSALVATNGNFDEAIAWIRKKNLDTDVGEKSSNEGLLGYQVSEDGKSITVVELSASTDFATQGGAFKDMLALLVIRAVEGGRGSVDELNAAQLEPNHGPLVNGELPLGKTCQEAVKELAGKVGENIFVKRVARVEGDFGYYVHHDSKQGAIVRLDKPNEALAKDVAMHVVFSKPTCLSRDQVSPEAVAKEKAIIESRLKEDPKNSSKPPQILEKISSGQLNKFYAQCVLLEQPHYRENKKSVEKVLSESGAKVLEFFRFHVGQD